MNQEWELLMSYPVGQQSGDYKEEYKISNKWFRSIKKRIGNKIKTIGFYISGDTGCKIKNAQTGINYNYLVGSKYEDLFFAVTIATGEYKRPPELPKDSSPEEYEKFKYKYNIYTALIKKGNVKEEPKKIYYNSPEEFEKHQHIVLDSSIKNQWIKKRDLFKQTLPKEIRENLN